ncbi:MAG: antitoxin VbhA family protein [Alphaproteobacteria bacterium]|nr:antitoxin VbhA family protein [Alphaproteobacteria bacterium]
MTKAQPPQEQISDAERERRKEAVDYARGSVRLEGGVLSEFAEDLNRRYINGEITREEKTAALLARYKP